MPRQRIPRSTTCLSRYPSLLATSTTKASAEPHPLYGVGDERAGVLHPGGREGGEVRVLAERLLRRDQRRDLREPAVGADSQVQWVRRLRLVQSVRGEKALGRRGRPQIDDARERRRAAESASCSIDCPHPCSRGSPTASQRFRSPSATGCPRRRTDPRSRCGTPPPGAQGRRPGEPLLVTASGRLAHLPVPGPVRTRSGVCGTRATRTRPVGAAARLPRPRRVRRGAVTGGDDRDPRRHRLHDHQAERLQPRRGSHHGDSTARWPAGTPPCHRGRRTGRRPGPPPRRSPPVPAAPYRRSRAGRPPPPAAISSHAAMRSRTPLASASRPR